MPIPGYAYFLTKKPNKRDEVRKDQKITGSVVVDGRNGAIEVLGFEHVVRIPSDPKDGSISGTRIHGAVRILKVYDAATVDLYKYLCNGTQIPFVVIDWYTIDPTAGTEVIYFTHTLTNAKIVNVKAWMPDFNDPKYERYKHMEWIELMYQKIRWQYPGMDGKQNFEHEDSWTEGR